MSPVAFFLFLFWLSFAAAQVEIAIEGPDGWAKNLPTYRFPEGHWISRVFFSDKPATAYHIWLEVSLVSVFHMVYLFTAFSWAIEFKVLAFFFFFCIVEDFFWFVFNPAFGIKNFRADKIWWHQKNWWVIAPRDYYVFFVIGTLLYWLSLHF